MGTNYLFSRRALRTVLTVLPLTFSVSCEFNPPAASDLCEDLEQLPITDLTAQGRSVVLETPGIITVMHGFGSAKLASGEYLKVEESLDIPSYANKATVFLNGWRSSYLGDDDQHVLEFGTMVGKIRLERTKLTWNAIGELRDDGGEEGFDWTYFYTVIAWNNAALNAFVNHDDAEKFCNADTAGSDNFYFTENGGTTTALSSFSSFLRNPDFPPRGIVAILPRGFGFAWDGDDHHLLQTAYNLDHSETFIEAGRKYKKAGGEENPLTTPASRSDSRFVSWNTYGIYKDNDGRRDYIFGEMVSAFGGNDVAVVQPPFSILPDEDAGPFTGCVSSSSGVLTQESVIENLPFEYAIPMLTGWELVSGCDDEHVKEIGIWIEEWSYVPGAQGGTLRYKVSSILRDKDSEPGHSRSQKVTILGLRPVDGRPVVPTGPSPT